MSQALYRKWRPARFDDVVGQEHVTRTLRNAVAAGRVGHAYLFCGPRGTGKTTTARLLAKAVNCLHEDESERPCNSCANCRAIREGRFLDLIEIDAASNTGVDDIRDLRDKINFSPSEGRFKVYIIDEVHMLSTAAFNALLKTLEEPPAHAKFVLATTEEHKVPMTIKSRCQQFNFRLLSLQEIAGRLQWMAGQESLELEPDALNLIARQGAGSIRDAESLLDQLVTAPGDQITLARAQMVLGTASSEAVAALTDALLSGDGPGGLAIIHEALTTGADARQFARQMVDHLRQVLLIQAAGDNVAVNATAEEQEVMQHQARRASREQLIAAVRAFNDAALSSSSSWQPQLPLELAFIEQLPEQPMPPTATAASEHGEPATQRQVKEAPEQTAPTPQTKTAAGAERPAETAQAAPPAAAPEETAAEPPAPEPKAPQEGPTASAAASARAEADTPQTTQSEDALSLQAIRDHWPAMVSQAGRQDKNLPALINMSKPLAIEGNTLILGFDYPMLKEKFEDKVEARTLVAEILSDLLGSKCVVRAVVTRHYTPPPSPPGATAEPAETAESVDSVEEAFHTLADELGGRVQSR